jgi:hypothetical protein
MPTWGIASLRQTPDFTPGYIAERSCRGELLDLADNSVDNDNVLFLEASLEVTSYASARALSSTNNSCRAARLCLFKTQGKQRL